MFLQRYDVEPKSNEPLPLGKICPDLSIFPSPSIKKASTCDAPDTCAIEKA